ncbi:MAG TPA: hypothetical protein VNN73_19615 [Blastocatellia bacterium]|nr:hypothetical protein [Blastocatellia bacterium]
MKNRIGFTLLFLLGFALGLVLMVKDARAQQPAPTGSSAQAPSGTQNGNGGNYEVISSIEIGARGILIHGNADKYRSDLNYTPGFRLFDESLLVQSKNNDGFLFDKLMVNSFGWGFGEGRHRAHDPNANLRVNAEKVGAYKFDANYRRMNYFNLLTNFANPFPLDRTKTSQHTFNTEIRQGDFDLTLLPQNERFKINLGYSLNRNSGPSVTTYDYQRDEFPVLSPVKYEANEYRAGFDAKLWVFDLSFMQGWRYFKDDTEYIVDMPQAGNNTTNTSVINTFKRDLPTRGTTPFTRLSLHSLLAKRVDITGRWVYSNSETNFNLLETITGKDSTGNNIILDKFTSKGKVSRPTAMGDVGVTVFITDKLRISNTFRVNNFRINGASTVAEDLLRSRTTAFGTTPLPPVFITTDYGRTTNYRRFFNQIEIDYDFAPQLSAHFGHRYTDRHIELMGFEQASNVPPGAEIEPDVFDNRTNTYLFGVKARPIRQWSLYFDAEHGEADNVFTRVDNYEFTNLRIRSILRPNRNLAINASLVTKDNSNPAALSNFVLDPFGVNIDSRIFTSSVDWTPSGKFYLSGGYTHSRMTSDVGIIFFLAGVKTTGRSQYFFRDNFAFVSAFIELHPRVRLYGAYRIHYDDGQGDRVSTSPTLLITSYPVQSYSPEARVSVKVHQRVDWIAGWQYFDFKERFGNRQFYQAHLPYTSLRFYFGRRE